MARRRMNRRHRARLFTRSKRSSGSSGNLMYKVLGAMAYGAFREKVSTMLTPLTNKVPLGNIADEVVLGATAVVLKKTIGRRMGVLNPILDGAIIVESARIGEAAINGQIGIGGNTNSNSNLLG